MRELSEGSVTKLLCELASRAAGAGANAPPGRFYTTCETWLIAIIVSISEISDKRSTNSQAWQVDDASKDTPNLKTDRLRLSLIHQSEYVDSPKPSSDSLPI